MNEEELRIIGEAEARRARLMSRHDATIRQRELERRLRREAEIRASTGRLLAMVLLVVGSLALTVYAVSGHAPWWVFGWLWP